MAQNQVAQNLVGLFADAGLAQPNAAQLIQFNLSVDGLPEEYKPTFQQAAKIRRAVEAQSMTRAVKIAEKEMTPYLFVSCLHSVGAIEAVHSSAAHSLITSTIVGKDEEPGLAKATVFKLWFESAESCFRQMQPAPAGVNANQQYNWRVRFTLTTVMKQDLTRAVGLKKVRIEMKSELADMKAEFDKKLQEAKSQMNNKRPASAPPAGGDPAKRAKSEFICEKWMRGNCTYRNCRFQHKATLPAMQQVNTKKSLGISEERMKQIATAE
eukprot:g19905.t1